MDYDFSNLNDKDFEKLVNDLISKKEGAQVESFKPGKDSGIDGRFFKYGSTVIIQSKHWLKSGFNKLKNHLEEQELEKIQKIKPKRYILATSVGLSPPQKTTIKELLKPFIVNEADILGQDDINALLRNFKEIEKKYYQLWLPSTNILEQLLNNDVYEQSQDELKKIQDQAKLYVKTINHDNAIKKLKDNNVVIITGEPGIGKTTLAKNLFLDFWVNTNDEQENYQFISAYEINDANRLYNPNKRQFFYFDDFLGSNIIEQLNDDRALIDFIEKIQRSNNKKFVLTSRTHILNDAVNKSDHFNNRNLRQNELMLNIDKIKDYEKARILYNHLFFYEIADTQYEDIIKHKRYLDVIGHKNFNPRIIEFITSKYRFENSEFSDYWLFVKSNLDNPEDIWRNAFKQQTAVNMQSNILLTVFNGGNIAEQELKQAYQNFNNNDDRLIIPTFKDAIRSTMNSFINKYQSRERQVSYQLFNPSITDFILKEYCQETETLKKVFVALNNHQAFNFLLSLLANNRITNDVCFQITFEMFEKSWNTKQDFNLIIDTMYFLRDLKEYRNKLIERYNFIIEKWYPMFRQFSGLIKL